MKPSELNQRNGLKRNLGIILSTFLIVGSAFVCPAGDGNGYAPIVYPSIFWHNNQWETYENGQWVPYRGSANNNAVVEPEPEEMIVPEQVPPPDMVDTNIYAPPYGWGFIGAPAYYRAYHHHRAQAHVRPEHRRPVNGIGQPNVGIGQSAIGIGKPNVGIGQSTIGIGRPNAGIGQPNVGIGRPNAGIGQTTIGIGQPNTAIGQPNMSVGQPNAAIGRATIGIGQPMSAPQGHSEQTRGR